MSHDEIMNDIKSPQENKRLDLVNVVRCQYCMDWHPFPDKLFGYCRREYWDDDGQYRLEVETNHYDIAVMGRDEMDDLISRQAALDAIERIFDRCEEIEAHLPEGDPDRTGYKMYPDYVTVWKYLHQVPSAQSERTCVNCGRTINNGGWYADGRTRCPIEEHYALPKDGYCHLWEKRNVTDDDYPERREE